MFVLPDVQIFKLEQLGLELSRQMTGLVETRRPKQIVLVYCLWVDTGLLLNHPVRELIEWQHIGCCVLRIARKPGHPGW